MAEEHCDMSASMAQVIELNVGGTLYTSTRSTLTAFPDSMLGNMFKGDLQPSHLDSHGRYFLDRDGDSFKYVLAYLRGQHQILSGSFASERERLQLMEEARFFQLEGLEQLLRDVSVTKQGCGAAEAQRTAKIEQFRQEAGPMFQKVIKAVLTKYWSKVTPSDLPRGRVSLSQAECLFDEPMMDVAKKYRQLLQHELQLHGYALRYQYSHGDYGGTCTYTISVDVSK